MWQALNQQCQLFDDCPGLSELFTRYLTHKKALQAIDGPSPTDTETFVWCLDDLLLVRGQHFTPTACDTLFSREQAWGEAALQPLQINQDPTLKKQQNRLLLVSPLNALPGPLKLPSAITPTSRRVWSTSR